MIKSNSKTVLKITFIVLFSFLVTATWLAADDEELDIPFKVHKLRNGLTLIVSEDHKSPIVSVNVWYHVGSKDEKPGKTGFAHLFEHLMFNGSENHDKEFFEPMQEMGAVLNGDTWFDRTRYYETVTKNALDRVLWLESDRMGHLLGAITQEKLDEQRGVVQNEKRQGENNPMGKVSEVIQKSLFPSDHPYSWTTIGSMEDLEAASLEDVHEWFKQYYGAANTVLSIAGDVNTEEVIAKVEKYFGNIQPGPQINRQEAWVHRWPGTRVVEMQLKVPMSMIIYTWNVPEWGHLEQHQLGLVAGILGGTETSRLVKRIVKEEQLATNVRAQLIPFEISSQFTIMVVGKPGVQYEKLEAVLSEELTRFLEEGPTEKEVRLAIARYTNGLVRGAESVSTKASLLASNMVYGGRPDYYKEKSKHIQSASVESLHAVSRKWLGDSLLKTKLVPYGTMMASGKEADRSSLPDLGETPTPRFPKLQRAKLSNGMEIILAERHQIPVISFNISMNTGSIADKHHKHGAAGYTFSHLEKGTESKTLEELSEEMTLLGMSFGASSGSIYSGVGFSLLKKNLDASLSLCTDVLLNPSFPDDELKLSKKLHVAELTQQKAMPGGESGKIMARELYGKDHPYAAFSTIETIKNLTRDDLIEFHKTWFRPNISTMVIVGDTTLAEIVPVLEKHLGGWQAADVPELKIPEARKRHESKVYIYNHPGATQTNITATRIMPKMSQEDDIALSIANYVIGGTFASRINMNLREDKHWTYGANTSVSYGEGPRTFSVSAPIQIDKTKEAIQEILNELHSYCGANPVTEVELTDAKKDNTLKLATQWESSRSIRGLMQNIVTSNLPDDYYDGYAEKIMNLAADEVKDIATKAFDSSDFVWMFVGDREKIEAGIKELNLGEIIYLDDKGNPSK